MDEFVKNLSRMPFHFWSVFLFIMGTLVGSFLNVCIHRMPRGESIVSPPSRCPHCGTSIPWYLNMPIITWLILRGRCASCQAPISVRYLLVEALTGFTFLATWLQYGSPDKPLSSLLLALVYCVFLAGLLVATFIDFEHFIIPDEITLGGIGAGFVLSFALPILQATASRPEAMKRSILGVVVGGGIIYLILRLGKLLFGKQNFDLPESSRVVFSESSLILPEQEIPYEDIFYRDSDTIVLEARQLVLPDRCYPTASLRLNPQQLRINEDTFKPDEVPRMEMITDRITVPREAMGFGDVKFMAGIGAFLGWPATLFALMVSSLIGATVGVVLIAFNRREWSSKIPYGPYIALAAALWLFGGKEWTIAWLQGSL